MNGWWVRQIKRQISWGHTTQVSQSLQILRRLGVHTNRLDSAHACMTTEKDRRITHLATAPEEGSQTA